MPETNRQRVVDIARRQGVLRGRDLETAGISRQYLPRLCAEGVLERRARGLYGLPDGELTEAESLVEANRRLPNGVICLLSALQIHELTTQQPFEVWMALSRKARLPRFQSPPVRVVRYSDFALGAGVEQYWVRDVPLPVYGVAKTVADCFKYRNKIGLEVALEALRDCWDQRKATMEQLWDAAKVCRMTNIMRPYLESLV